MSNAARALRQLEAGGLVRRLEEIELAYQFKHVLTQETTYHSLLRQQRREWHGRVARIYETIYAAELDAYLLIIAEHYAEAEQMVPAVAYFKRYAKRAAQMSAYPEAVRAYERALALMPGDDATAGERARLLIELGDIFCRQSEYAAAQARFESAIALSESANQPEQAASALAGLARVESQHGDHVQARGLGESALEWARRSGDRAAIARALRQLGVAYNYEGNNELARRTLLECLELYRSLDDRDGVASALNSLGVVARDQRDLASAESYFREALEISRQLGDRYSIGIRLVNLGVIAEQRGDFELSERYEREALALASEIGDREGVALITLNLGSLALNRSDFAGAMNAYRQALADSMSLHLHGLALYTLAAIAKLEVKRGHPERGARLLGLAWNHPASTADIRADFASVMQELESTLPAEQLTLLLQGGGMTLDQAAGAILADDHAQ